MSRSKSKNKTPVKRQNPPKSHTTTTREIVQQQSFSGPIPSPDILDRYNQIIPNAAERILTMAESDAQHQRDIEMLAIKCQASENRRGQYFGVVVTALAFVTAGVALYLGHPTAAAVIGGTTVVGLATAFVVGKRA